MRFDFLLVGGGLQSVLATLAVLARTPKASVCIVEAAREIGGNHTWCFHAGDVPVSLRSTFEPLVSKRWERWGVSFPNTTRTFDKHYAMVTSASLRRAVDAAFRENPDRVLRLGTPARHVGRSTVRLDDDTILESEIVVDARGPRALDVACGWQKFVGLELELDAPHSFAAPIVIDAKVHQRDGFRFFYVLPISPTRVLVEETFFSDTPTLNEHAGARAVFAYAKRHGLSIRRTVRDESGVLPLPLEWPGTSAATDGPILAGYGGGFFHPTTGYSFPVAARVAERLAQTSAADLHGAAWDRFRSAHDRQARFAVLLNRLLFSATTTSGA
ncbi:MAG TPA: lycopene beta-cyclase CrtY, partial [Polyangiaceae bacterium]